MNNQIGIIAVVIPLLMGASTEGDTNPYRTFNDEILSLESLESFIGEIEQRQMPKIEEEVVEELPRSIYSGLERTYRQTYYSVQQGEHSLGAGFNKDSKEVTVIDNVMNFNDYEYGYLPIIAVNINEVKSFGQDSTGVWNMYGTVVELNYEDGSNQKAIILDACGACSKAEKIDLWVWNNDVRHDVQGVELRVIRDGWGYTNEIRY